MTVKDYIVGRFQSFGVKLSEADLLDISQNGSEEITSENIKEIQIAITRFIPSLLARPNISESGFSLTRAQGSDIKDYYKYQCKVFGLENVFKTKISFS